MGRHRRRRSAAAGLVPADWRERFLLSYDIELREWVDTVATARPPLGPSSWDGYAAQVVCDAGVKALYDGDRVQIELGDKPPLYR